jgi:hypothetical protein
LNLVDDNVLDGLGKREDFALEFHGVAGEPCLDVEVEKIHPKAILLWEVESQERALARSPCSKEKKTI